MGKRWHSDSQLDSLLVSGFSLGEGIAVAVIVGGLLAMAVVRYSPALEHTAVTEALMLSRGGQIDWMEQWASQGQMPVADSALRMPLPQEKLKMTSGIPGKSLEYMGRTVKSLDGNSTDGEIAFQMRAALGSPQSATLQFRPAFGPGEIPASVLWLCGRATVPVGFLRLGEDRTTLSNEALPSACRDHS